MISLRPYQQTGVQGIRDAFKKHRSVLFCLSTGGGKTYTFSYIADAAAKKNRRVMILVHRKELLEQASRSLASLGVRHGLISPDYTPNRRELIQVASVDTVKARFTKFNYETDLLIVDECHHVTQSNKWGKVYELLGNPHMLGVTATPVRADGIGLGVHAGGLFDDMVIGPATPELIEMGFLVKPEVYTSLDFPDVSSVKKTKSGDYNTEQLAEAVDRPRITGNAVEQYSKICPGSKAIVFCININHAKHVMAEFNAAGYRFALLVGAPTMSGAERNEVNEGLKNGKYHGACTVDLVSEGYDLPALQTCVMLRPTTSESLFLQQVGRIMRPFEGEIKYLLDHVGNVGSYVNGEFKPKHGLPHWEREWTLDGRQKRAKKSKDEEEIKIKQCERCYLVHEPAPQCPHCGFIYPIIERRNIEQVDGELKKVDAEIEAQIKRENYRKQGQAQTIEELMSLGNSKWHAEKIIASRKEKQNLISNVIADLTKWQEQTRDQPFKRFGVTYGSIKTLKPKQLKELHEQIKQELLC